MAKFIVGVIVGTTVTTLGWGSLLLQYSTIFPENILI